MLALAPRFNIPRDQCTVLSDCYLCRYYDRTQEWHRPRVAALVSAGADLLAVETVPGPEEALAVLELLREYPDTPGWVSFSCKVSDTRHMVEHIERVAKQRAVFRDILRVCFNYYILKVRVWVSHAG